MLVKNGESEQLIEVTHEELNEIFKNLFPWLNTPVPKKQKPLCFVDALRENWKNENKV